MSIWQTIACCTFSRELKKKKSFSKEPLHFRNFSMEDFLHISFKTVVKI